MNTECVDEVPEYDHLTVTDVDAARLDTDADTVEALDNQSCVLAVLLPSLGSERQVVDIWVDEEKIAKEVGDEPLK